MARPKRSKDSSKDSNVSETAGPETPLRLTSEDVERLLNSSTAGEAKMEVTAKMAKAYAANNFGPREIAIAEQIFRLLVRDTEVAVRMILAEQVKNSRALPHDIALAMARDVTDVAMPILRFSEVLTDDDLVALVQEAMDVSRQVAISQRKTVSERVGTALIDTGEAEVAKALMANKGAILNEATLQTVLERYSTKPGVMKSMAERPDLPLTVAEKLVAHVSSTLGNRLRKKYYLPETKLTREETTARSEATVSLLHQTGGAEDPEEVMRLIKQLRAFNRLNFDMVFSALSQGYMTFFEAAMANLSGVPFDSAQRLIRDQGELGFRAIYNKSGLPPEQFAEMQRLLQNALTKREYH